MRRERIAPRALAAALTLLAGCAGAHKPATPASGIVGPVWVAADIAGTTAGTEAPVTLQLGADGRASGHGGCNGYVGSFTLAGDALTFGPLASTRMACASALMDREQRYFETLAQVAHYAVADDGALLLTTADGKTIRFRRQ